MFLGVPLVAVGLPVAYLVITRLAFPVGNVELAGGKELIRRELKSLGPMTTAEKRVMAVFIGTAFLWITRPILARWVPGLSDAGIAMLAAVALFLVPSGDEEQGGMLLNWRLAEATPWGILVLFGGGLSLAAAFRSTGLDAWIGAGVGSLHEWPLILLVLVVVAVVIFLTELTSNTATAATFLPVLGSVAIGLGDSPMVLAVPAALAATSAFMLPVATPPNAIVYSSGEVTIQQMARTGLILNVIFTLLITAAAWLLLPVVFGV
jgi:sodium-dependent dicarboxylate transporter 2/3/5